MGLAGLSFAPVATLTPQRIATKKEAVTLISEAVRKLQPAFHRIDSRSTLHLRKILDAMRQEKLAPHHFQSSDGYGHSDHGRDTLDRIYARLFETEAACVRIQFHSGTHAIACVLYGILRHGDELVALAGPVYDTLEEVIGTRGSGSGSLAELGISFRCLPLRHGRVDFDAIPAFISPKTKMVFIQRSFGYTWREALTNSDIARITKIVKGVREDIVVFVDNCYGEFVEDIEPVHPTIGADIMAGSLIKNLGGGIAPSGAYIAGRKELVHLARCRLAAPGVGGGATLGHGRTLAQGLFLSPGTIGESLKGGLLVGEVMNELGYEVLPAPGVIGFVRAVKLGDVGKLVEFCRAVQKAGPVGAFFEPSKGMSDGYGDEVVFAQANFVDGSTAEMSADGPVREPYTVFAQGGLFWGHWVVALEEIVQRIGWNERQFG